MLTSASNFPVTAMHPENNNIDHQRQGGGEEKEQQKQTKREQKQIHHHQKRSVLLMLRVGIILLFLTSSAALMLVFFAPIAFFSLRFLSIHHSRRAVSFIFGHWLAIWPYLFEKVNKTRVRFSGDQVPSKERILVICNHRTEVDWVYIWNLALRKGRIGYVKYVLKSSVRNVPVFGWAFHIFEFLLIDRNWQADEAIFKTLLSTFQDPKDPLWLVIFPEGTDYTEEKCQRSQKFAEEHSLPKLNHVLLPRTKGFYACLEQLRGSIDAVYDLTISYKDHPPLFIENALGTNPREVHIHINRTPISDVPVSEAETSDWLINCFAKKDELLQFFAKEGRFPGREVEGDLNTLHGAVNAFAILICTCAILWLLFITSTWVKVYATLSCVGLTASTFFNYIPHPLVGRSSLQ